MHNSNFSNIREILQNSVSKYRSNNAFVIKNKEKKHIKITYKKFGEDIEKMGTALLKMGLKGKKIAVIGKNRYEWAVSYYAIVCGVGVAVPLDKGLPEDEIENSLLISKADAIIFEEKYCNQIQEIIKRNKTNISTLICMDTTSQYNSFEELLKLGEKELKEENFIFSKQEIDENKTSIILFTSGTTSIAKAVELSHKNIASNINGLNRHETFLDTDVNMAFLPFHHTFGSTGLLLFLCNGATTVFCDGLRYVQKNLAEYKVSVFFCVPLIIEAMHKKIIQEVEKQNKQKKLKFAKIINRMLLAVGIDIRKKLFKDILNNLGGHLRIIISGAAPIDPKIEKDFNEFGILTIQGYGLTETSPVLCAENVDNLKYGSIGKPLYNVEIKINNPNEEGIGQIIARGPNIMKGYFENEEDTKKVLKEGWFYTGDLGRIDKDGYIYICGRQKNVIVLKNGKNVYPEELEILIGKLPYVEENIVFGIEKEDDYILASKIVYNKSYIEEKYPNINSTKINEIIWKDIKNLNSNLCNYKHIKKLFIADEPMNKTTTNKIKRDEEIKKLHE